MKNYRQSVLTLFVLLLFVISNGQILTESFDSTSFPPAGWSNVRIAGFASPGTWLRVAAGTNPTCTPHSGAAMAYFNSYSWSGGNASDLATPTLDFSSGTFAVSFWMYRDGGQTSKYDSVAVYVNTTVSSAGGTRIGLVNRAGNLSPAVQADGWYQYTFNIPASYSTATNHIIFKATSDFGNRMYIDDVTVYLFTPPTDVDSVTATSQQVCTGSQLTLHANGIDGAVYWYADSCGGTSIATGDGITVSPSQNTTYFARNFNNNLFSINCASVSITVNPVYNTVVYDTICAGQSYLLHGGQHADTTGTYSINQLSAAGCDSNTTVYLTVRPATYGALQLTGCAGNTITYNNKSYTSAGVFADTLVNYYGCDSIVTLTIAFTPAITTNVQQTICFGDTFLFNGNVYFENGTYYDTLTAANGCDSILTITITQLPLATGSIALSSCFGGSVEYNGEFYSSTGTYTDTLTATTGCDSIVTIQVAINAPLASAVNFTICNNDSVLYSNNYYYTAGTFYDTLTAQSGCDSFVTIIITQLQVLSSTVNFALCQGSSIEYNERVYSIAGTYTDTLTATSGCDSIVAIQIDALPANSSNVNLSICPGDSIVYNNITYTTAGSYTDTLAAATGCDSVLYINVNTLPLITSTVNITICPGDSAFYNGSYYYAAGTYTDTLSSIYGCDSISLINISTYNVDTPVVTQNGQVLETGIYNSYQWLKDNSPISNANGQTYAVAQNGNYAVLTTDENGCTAISQAVNVTGTDIQYSADSRITLYPNPANTTLYFKGLKINCTYNVMIYNPIGLLVTNSYLTASNGLDVSGLPSGVYTLSLQSGLEVVHYTFIKQ
ncbi:MAG TPA: T9SS type A sorting domain-containing protein [Chitinophagales bacterium]|nr:T9SS type A sorting domain-containing protein [Chitinophagales bacterium]